MQLFHIHSMRRFVWLAAAIVVLGAANLAAADTYTPPAIYLTWQEDPATTMVVHWHTNPGDDVTGVNFAPIDSDEWTTVAGSEEAMYGSDQTIHTAHLTGLEPGARYQFRLGDYEPVYQFETMPADNSEPIRFVVGGDTAPLPLFGEMCEMAASHEPMFAIIGGDLAYADGEPEQLYRWEMWFTHWRDRMVTPSGRLVPVIVAIGNHEVQLRYHHRGASYEHAPYFFSYFAFPDIPGYNALDFGDYMSLIILDSGHVNPIEGEQTEWLASALAERQDKAHVFPIYHVPGYPSYRDYDGSLQTAVREHWVPLFEEHGVRVVFEHHDHTFKRTHPIRGGEIDEENGILYLGDGAWGVPLRTPMDADDEWYLARTAERAHVFVVTLEGDTATYEAVDPDNVVFDRVRIEGGQPPEITPINGE